MKSGEKSSPVFWRESEPESESDVDKLWDINMMMWSWHKTTRKYNTNVNREWKMAEEKRERVSERAKNKQARANKRKFIFIFVESFFGELSILQKVFFLLAFCECSAKDELCIWQWNCLFSVYIFVYIPFLTLFSSWFYLVSKGKSSLFPSRQLNDASSQSASL